MRCHNCHENIDSILVNGIETEHIRYECGKNMYNIHMGCIRNHYTENWGKKCMVCKGENLDCKLEDVKATLETVLQLDKLRLWKDLGW